MSSILLVLQSIIVLLLVALILLQKSDGNNLAGLSGGGTGVVSSRARTNFISKFTMILGVLFMVNSLIIAKLAVKDAGKDKNILQSLGTKQAETELEAPIAD